MKLEGETGGSGELHRLVIEGYFAKNGPGCQLYPREDQIPARRKNGQGTFPGPITREWEPINLEFPFPTLDGLLTPNDQFYIRNHFGVPKIDAAKWHAAKWHLDIGGEGLSRDWNVIYQGALKLREQRNGVATPRVDSRSALEQHLDDLRFI